MKGTELTPRQRRFVNAFLHSFNGTSAAIAAGYSPRTAAAQASRLLRNQKIREFLTTADRPEDLRITRDRLRSEAARLAFGPTKAPDKLHAIALLLRFFLYDGDDGAEADGFVPEDYASLSDSDLEALERGTRALHDARARRLAVLDVEGHATSHGKNRQVVPISTPRNSATTGECAP